jgi:hypothetical protein
MGNKFKFSLFAFVMQSFVTSLCAAEIRLAEAPFGLQFGMRAEDVKLPISPVPNKPWRLQQRLSNNGFGIDIPTAEEIREEDQYNAQYVARESLIKGCIKSFDSPYLSNYGDASWFEWTHSKGISSELSDLHPRSLLDSPQYDLYFKFQEQIDKIEFPHPDAFRSVSIHTVKAAGIDRDVCLIFTEVGLAYVYAPLKALEDVINEIYVRLAANSEYENYLSRSKYMKIRTIIDLLPSVRFG